MGKKEIPNVIHNLALSAQKVVKNLQEFKKALERYEEPYCEISQSDKGVKINIRLPSVKKRSISLRMNSRKMEVKGQNGRTNYYKIIDIPSVVDITRARAIFNNGTLRVVLPYARAL